MGCLLTGCEDKVVEKYDSDASLYFYRNMNYANDKGIVQYDSIDYSFFLAGSAQESDIWLQVQLTGNLSDQPRSFKIVQTNAEDANAAVAGTHYVAFDDPEMKKYLVLPAHATKVLVPIKLKRTADMDKKSFRLALALVPNENFAEGIKQGNYGQSSFIINITAEAIKPVTWDRNYDYTFGEWSKVKMGFLINEVKFTDFTTDMSNLENRYFWNLKAKSVLADYEAKHGTLYEDDGITKVVIP